MTNAAAAQRRPAAPHSYVLRAPTIGPRGSTALLAVPRDWPEVAIDGRPLRIPRGAHAILYALCRKAGTPVPREALAQTVNRWVWRATGSAPSVTAQISVLRRRLREAGVSSPILSVATCGYLVPAATRQDAPPGETYRLGDLVVDLDRAQARVAGRPVRMTPMAARLLALLAREGRTMDGEAILDGLRGDGPAPKAGRAWWVVGKARAEIAAAGGPNPIETVVGQGYRIRR